MRKFKKTNEIFYFVNKTGHLFRIFFCKNNLSKIKVFYIYNNYLNLSFQGT